MKGTQKRLLIILTAAACICMAYSVWEHYFRVRERVTYLEKDPAGSAEREVDLKAVVDGEHAYELDIAVPSVPFTREEADRYFEEAANEIETYVYGEGNRVSRDISLPTSFPDNPVSIEWQSSRPGILSSSGKIGNPDAGGEEVSLTASMRLGDYEDRYILSLIVFPAEGTGEMTELLKSEAEKLNDGSADARYYLPSEADGRQVTWYVSSGSRAGTLAAVLLLTAVLLAVRARKQKEKEEKARTEELKKAYPELLSRILLLSHAGMGLRRAMYRTAAAYREAVRDGSMKNRRALCDEIERVCADMDNGIGEAQAYENLGVRCAGAGYRPLGVLLSRGVSRGSAGLVNTLEQEVASAFEESKRRAKAAGDMAAVKLLLPMAMMLVVVMVVVLVPSFLSF